MTDFIIVGRGLAANVLMHRFLHYGISFNVIGNENLSNCSKIAAGIWNPIVFKRLTKSWKAEEVIKELQLFYSYCEWALNKKLLTQRIIVKPFTEDQEKVLWKKKAKTELSEFLYEDVFENKHPELENCHIENEYGIVDQAGNLNMEIFLDATSKFFKNQIQNETFDYKLLEILTDSVKYKSHSAKRIIFCEGHLVSQNPYFNWIPLKPVKGEVMEVESPALKFNNVILNYGGFLMDTEKHQFKCGATYDWNNLDETPTLSGLNDLEKKYRQLVSANYRLISHKAGIRPASIDRRPIIGAHPIHKQLYVFNGLGTKGVMLAPYCSKQLINHLLKGENLHHEIDVQRFYNKSPEKN